MSIKFQLNAVPNCNSIVKIDDPVEDAMTTLTEYRSPTGHRSMKIVSKMMIMGELSKALRTSWFKKGNSII